jgi:hypothetical protein
VLAVWLLLLASAAPSWGQQEAVLVLIDAGSPIAAFDGAAVVDSIVQGTPSASACSWTQGPYGGDVFYVRMQCPDLALATDAANSARGRLPAVYSVYNVSIEAPLPRYATREWKPAATPLIVASVISGIIALIFIAVFVYMVRRTNSMPSGGRATSADFETRLLSDASGVERFDCE